jgi:dUTPase
MPTASSLWGHEAAAIPGKSLFELIRATPGSAGLDLCSTTNIVLSPEMGVQTLPTGVFGPLPAETWRFLLGQRSTFVKGLKIYPGVIDNDYEGEIKIMVASPHGELYVLTKELLNLL